MSFDPAAVLVDKVEVDVLEAVGQQVFQQPVVVLKNSRSRPVVVCLSTSWTVARMMTTSNLLAARWLDVLGFLEDFVAMWSPS